MKVKVLELFGGIGACTAALKRIGIDVEVVDYVEIDKYAVASYNAINGTNFESQDICTWDKNIEVDLIMHGSPCQDFSVAGKQAGGDEGSGTRSSLMYETIRIVGKLRPKYVVWENVKNLLSAKHRHNFDAYLDTMKALGYTNYYQVLNAKDYGIPQNRERVFTVSIRNDIEKKYEFPAGEKNNNSIKIVGNYMPSNHDASRIVDEEGIAPTVKENHGTVTAVLQRFEFPLKQELKKRLKDLLEDKVDKKYWLSDNAIGRIRNWKSHQKPFERVLGQQSLSPTLTARGAGEEHSGMILYSDNLSHTTNLESVGLKSKSKKLIALLANTNFNKGEVLNLDLYNQTTNTDVSQCLTEPNHNSQRLFDGYRIRKLTPKECWRLMGFSDDDFEKASKVNSDTQLYKQAGNSIVVNVLESIFKCLLLNQYSGIRRKKLF